MRIEALKYRTEDKDIIIFVELCDYGCQNSELWDISDIQYKKLKQRKYRHLSSEFKDDYEYKKLNREERKQYERDKFVKFVGIDKIREAISEAWKNIQPNNLNTYFYSI